MQRDQEEGSLPRKQGQPPPRPPSKSRAIRATQPQKETGHAFISILTMPQLIHCEPAPVVAFVESLTTVLAFTTGNGWLCGGMRLVGKGRRFSYRLWWFAGPAFGSPHPHDTSSFSASDLVCATRQQGAPGHAKLSH